MTEVLLKRIKSLKENIKIIEKCDIEEKLKHAPLKDFSNGIIMRC